MTHHPFGLYAAVAGGALVVTLLLVPLCRRLALWLGVVDRPGGRKIHKAPTPYLGGLAFYGAFLAVVLGLAIAAPDYLPAAFIPIGIVGTAIVLMGIYDDILDLSSAKKLIIELALGVGLLYFGFRTEYINIPFGGTFNAGWLAFIVAPLWVAAVINAVNFCDGLDGLAAGLVFICSAAIFAIGLKQGQVTSCIIMAYLMGTTLGFLRYNFHPASVFMGDAGALFLGFILGVTTLVEQQKGVATIALAVPMIVLAIPMVDTFLSFLRRMQRARQGKFFQPDRNHLHHRLLDLGLSQPQVVLSLYYISVCMGLLAFILSVVPPAYSVLILLLAVMAISFGVIVLRFVEGFADREREH